jgi:hypothetical protein
MTRKHWYQLLVVEPLECSCQVGGSGDEDFVGDDMWQRRWSSGDRRYFPRHDLWWWRPSDPLTRFKDWWFSGCDLSWFTRIWSWQEDYHLYMYGSQKHEPNPQKNCFFFISNRDMYSGLSSPFFSRFVQAVKPENRTPTIGAYNKHTVHHFFEVLD